MYLTSNNDPVGLHDQILDMDAKLQRACRQVTLLDAFIQDVQHRYDKASQSNIRTCRYYLRLRLSVSEGVRNAYYEYASKMADKIEVMEIQLERLGVQPLRLYPDEDFVDTDASESDNWGSNPDLGGQ